MSFKYLVASSLFAKQALAWWGTGHLMTARVAYDRLIATDNEEVIELVEEQLDVLRSFVHMEQNHPFVECATFADFIKNSGFNDLSTWHYVDTPFFDEGYTTEVHDDPSNVVWAIDQMHKQIVDPVGTIYGPVNPTLPVDLSFGRSFNMRLLIHYFGDIHQPLHSVSRYTENYPNGDAGGNLFGIPASGPDGGVTNLHAVWDSVAYAYADFIDQPLTDDSWEFLGREAFKIQMSHPFDSFDLAELTRPESEWYTETLELAETVVYPGAIENEPLSEEYIQNAAEIAKRQIAKGGYRLADELIQIKMEIDALSKVQQFSQL